MNIKILGKRSRTERRRVEAYGNILGSTNLRTYNLERWSRTLVTEFTTRSECETRDIALVGGILDHYQLGNKVDVAVSSGVRPLGTLRTTA